MSPRPAFRSSLIRGLFDSGPDAPRDSRTTLEVDAERDLLPDEHILATHVDIAELGTAHHPLSSAPTSSDVVGGRPRRGGGWVLVAGAALLLAPILFGSRRPPEVAKPETAAAAAPPPALPRESEGMSSRDEHELAIRFALAREPGDALDARRELALDPVYLGNPPSAPRAPRGGSARAFDEGAALAAIRNAGLGSPQCGENAAGATLVSVTFAPSGRVTRALVEDGPLQGTAVGGCIARHLRTLSVPPFDGDFRTVRTDVTLR
jgi:hypothetical protein